LTAGQLYHRLMNEFQSLAEDASKQPVIGSLIHGFIRNAKSIIRSQSSSNMKGGLLKLFSKTTHEITSPPLAATLAVPQPSSHELSIIIQKASSTADSQKSKLPSEMTAVTRPVCAGRTKTLRLKSRHETMKSSKTKSITPRIRIDDPKKGNQEPKVKEGLKRQCGYCGMRDGHRYDGRCEQLESWAYVVSKEHVDELVFNVVRHTNDSRLGLFQIPQTATLMKQVDNSTKFLCIHGYGMLQEEGNLSQSTSADMCYLCVTIVKGYGVIQDQYKKCFVRTSAVTQWITKNQINKKHVLLARNM
jgi:hypothetical protein